MLALNVDANRALEFKELLLLIFHEYSNDDLADILKWLEDFEV